MSRIADALKLFGWTDAPEFWKQYHSHPWVFNLANALARTAGDVERLTAERDEARAGLFIANTERNRAREQVVQLTEALRAQNKATGLIPSVLAVLAEHVDGETPIGPLVDRMAGSLRRLVAACHNYGLEWPRELQEARAILVEYDTKARAVLAEHVDGETP